MYKDMKYMQKAITCESKTCSRNERLGYILLSTFPTDFQRHRIKSVDTKAYSKVNKITKP